MPKINTTQEYIQSTGEWKACVLHLRKIILDLKMDENIKWSRLTYSAYEKNIVSLSAFKKYVGIWFFQGGLLRDKQEKLQNAQEGKTKAMRQWRFYSLEEIKNEEPLIKAYLKETLSNFKAGKAVKPQNRKALILAKELIDLFKKDRKLEVKFEELSLSKRRDYSEYIDTAKHSETKATRLAKIKPMILSGIGLNDKYKK